MKFNSRIQMGGRFGDFTQEQVKNEPMFFNSGLHYAIGNGGPITRAFIRRFLEENPFLIERGCVFDSRVHMLMKGWFPCIPGYHHDDVPRGDNGQPDYLNPNRYRSKHVMGLVNGEICPTQFALGEFDLEIPEGVIYKQWHEDVDFAVKSGMNAQWWAPTNRLVYFDDETFHQGQRANGNGWRWFGRISWATDRSQHVTNEIRRQVQVYLEYPMEGW